MYRLEVTQPELKNVLGKNSVKRFKVLFLGEDKKLGYQFYIPELNEVIYGREEIEYPDEFEIELEYIGKYLYIRNFIFPLGEEVEETVCMEFA